MTPDQKAIATMRHVDLAFCRIFGKTDQLQTQVSNALGALPEPAEDIPVTHRLAAAMAVGSLLRRMGRR